MLTRTEFDTWFDDYRSRFPAVNDYLSRQPTRMTVLDTWYASVSAFDADVIGVVTSGIIQGTFDPVPNVQLGQFGNEIRKLCRAVLDARREQDHREEWRQPKGKPYTPLFRGRMLEMYRASQAVAELLGPQACNMAHTDDVHWDHPTCGAYCAAIILADDHTAYEEECCVRTLEAAGLTWQQVQALAAQSHETMQEALDGQVRS